MRATAVSFAILLASLHPAPAAAEGRDVLGVGRLFTNDWFGDGQDRWRTGSYALSVVTGPQGALAPGGFGEVLEFRLRTEIIAPDHGTGRSPDRPYVGALSFGLHGHSALGPLDLSVGGDAVVIGPQTGVSDFHEGYHDTFSLPDPPGTESQLGNDVLFGATAELAWPLRVSDRLTLRPFAEAQAGVEDLVRVGGDVVIGAVGHDDLMIRDVPTGHLYRGIEGPETGFAVVLGADWTQVRNSAFLPEDLGYSPEETRLRARGGVHWQLAPKVSFFYGLTWLSEEFEGQPEGQILGSVKLNFNY